MGDEHATCLLLRSKNKLSDKTLKCSRRDVYSRAMEDKGFSALNKQEIIISDDLMAL